MDTKKLFELKQNIEQEEAQLNKKLGELESKTEQLTQLLGGSSIEELEEELEEVQIKAKNELKKVQAMWRAYNEQYTDAE